MSRTCAAPSHAMLPTRLLPPLLSNPAGRLLHAAVTDDTTLLQQSLDEGADPAQPVQHVYNMFMLAARCGSLAVLRKLYEVMPPRVLDEADLEQDYHTVWPLPLAVNSGVPGVVAQLLDWGAVCCSYKLREGQDESRLPWVREEALGMVCLGLMLARMCIRGMQGRLRQLNERDAAGTNGDTSSGIPLPLWHWHRRSSGRHIWLRCLLASGCTGRNLWQPSCVVRQSSHGCMRQCMQQIPWACFQRLPAHPVCLPTLPACPPCLPALAGCGVVRPSGSCLPQWCPAGRRQPEAYGGHAAEQARPEADDTLRLWPRVSSCNCMLHGGGATPRLLLVVAEGASAASLAEGAQALAGPSLAQSSGVGMHF